MMKMSLAWSKAKLRRSSSCQDLNSKELNTYAINEGSPDEGPQEIPAAVNDCFQESPSSSIITMIQNKLSALIGNGSRYRVKSSPGSSYSTPNMKRKIKSSKKGEHESKQSDPPVPSIITDSTSSPNNYNTICGNVRNRTPISKDDISLPSLITDLPLNWPIGGSSSNSTIYRVRNKLPTECIECLRRDDMSLNHSIYDIPTNINDRLSTYTDTAKSNTAVIHPSHTYLDNGYSYLQKNKGLESHVEGTSKNYLYPKKISSLSPKPNREFVTHDSRSRCCNNSLHTDDDIAVNIYNEPAQGKYEHESDSDIYKKYNLSPNIVRRDTSLVTPLQKSDVSTFPKNVLLNVKKKISKCEENSLQQQYLSLHRLATSRR